MEPPRIPLSKFPDVVIHAPEHTVKRHAYYSAAKSGDLDAASRLVNDTLNEDAIVRLANMVENSVVEFVPIHALEAQGVNEIPVALANRLASRLGGTVNDAVVQSNTVGHTGASGFHRLANQASFSGAIMPEAAYFVVDDFVGQGGTLANLIGFIESNAGRVLGATVLTGRDYSAKIAPSDEMIQLLRKKHGQVLEKWWEGTFGFGFEKLTHSEARYLERTPDAQTIRDRITERRS